MQNEAPVSDSTAAIQPLKIVLLNCNGDIKGKFKECLRLLSRRI